MKHQIHDDQGQVWEFDTDNGCLLHPGELLTSWLRDNRPMSWWCMLETAEDVPPCVVERINALECGGDPARRYVEGTPEALPVNQELDKLSAIAVERYRALEGSDPNVIAAVRPFDMLKPEEKARWHELQQMTRPVAREEAAESVRLRRIKRLQAQARHTAQSLVYLVKSAGGKHDITHPTWMKEVTLALAPLLPDDITSASAWESVRGIAWVRHLTEVRVAWAETDETQQQKAVMILLALILSRQQKDRTVGVVGNFSAEYGKPGTSKQESCASTGVAALEALGYKEAKNFVAQTEASDVNAERRSLESWLDTPITEMTDVTVTERRFGKTNLWLATHGHPTTDAPPSTTQEETTGQ